MKLRYSVNYNEKDGKQEKVYTLKISVNNKETMPAHYKFIKFKVESDEE